VGLAAAAEHAETVADVFPKVGIVGQQMKGPQEMLDVTS